MYKNRLPSKVALAPRCTLRQYAGVWQHKALEDGPDLIVVGCGVRGTTTQRAFFGVIPGCRPGVDEYSIDYVGFYEKPFLKLERLLETYLSFALRGFRSFLRLVRRFRFIGQAAGERDMANRRPDGAESDRGAERSAPRRRDAAPGRDVGVPVHRQEVVVDADCPGCPAGRSVDRVFRHRRRKPFIYALF